MCQFGVTNELKDVGFEEKKSTYIRTLYATKKDRSHASHYACSYCGDEDTNRFTHRTLWPVDPRLVYESGHHLIEIPRLIQGFEA